MEIPSPKGYLKVGVYCCPPDQNQEVEIKIEERNKHGDLRGRVLSYCLTSAIIYCASMCLSHAVEIGGSPTFMQSSPPLPSLTSKNPEITIPC